MKRAALILLLLAAARPMEAADCAPKKLVEIVVEDSSPKTPTDSFSAKPKTIYRLGARFLRIEEQPDPAHLTHGLIVVAEPDSWLIDLAKGKGRHFMDKDSQGVVRAPVFSLNYGNSFPALLRDLEFGCEAEFFQRHGSPIEPLKQAVPPVYKQALGVNGWMVVLLRADRSGSPTGVLLFHGNDIVSAFRYKSYETREKGNPSLFERPSGVVFTETGG